MYNTSYQAVMFNTTGPAAAPSTTSYTSPHGAIPGQAVGGPFGTAPAQGGSYNPVHLPYGGNQGGPYNPMLAPCGGNQYSPALAPGNGHQYSPMQAPCGGYQLNTGITLGTVSSGYQGAQGAGMQYTAPAPGGYYAPGPAQAQGLRGDFQCYPQPAGQTRIDAAQPNYDRRQPVIDPTATTVYRNAVAEQRCAAMRNEEELHIRQSELRSAQAKLDKDRQKAEAKARVLSACEGWRSEEFRAAFELVPHLAGAPTQERTYRPPLTQERTHTANLVATNYATRVPDQSLSTSRSYEVQTLRPSGAAPQLNTAPSMAPYNTIPLGSNVPQHQRTTGI